ncbi:MAG TPA: hypothetical protein PLD20_20820 [Blastocatellia bacterium]|nr:hypothetical protein [Blastocatellia bacterium]HMZ20392.1 hypothetical protein [Blastocatellia bacterium]HNG31861.1 hypothetical protein [Blastocatellia bacterium]
MKRKTAATTRPLENFSKEALLAFIKANIAWGNPYWESMLIRIEAEQKYNKLKVEVDERIEKSKELRGLENYEASRANHERIDSGVPPAGDVTHSAPLGRRSFLLCPPLRVSAEGRVAKFFSGFAHFTVLINYEHSTS